LLAGISAVSRRFDLWTCQSAFLAAMNPLLSASESIFSALSPLANPRRPLSRASNLTYRFASQFPDSWIHLAYLHFFRSAACLIFEIIIQFDFYTLLISSLVILCFFDSSTASFRNADKLRFIVLYRR
jgi:predicted small integral membrane protein